MGRLLSIALGAALAASCSGPINGLTDEERSLVHQMQLHAPPFDPSNRFQYEPAAIALGHQLFFDPRISGKMTVPQSGQTTLLGDGGTDVGFVACADCHSPNHFFSDDRSSPNNVSLGTGLTKRNSPGLVNVASYGSVPGTAWFSWDGQSDSLWMQCDVAYESPKAMAGNALRMARIIQSTYTYRDELAQLDPAAAAKLGQAADGGLFRGQFGDSCFEDPDSGVLGACAARLEPVMAIASKSLAAYLNTLVSNDSPFDKFAAGDDGALDEQQLRGLELFLDQAGCITCHDGPFFTDRQFHNTGLSAGTVSGEPVVDNGRFGAFTTLRTSAFTITGPFSDLGTDAGIGAQLVAAGYPGGPVPENNGQFRTKSLRNVAQTGPFMHAGQLETLRDVIDFYNAGGNPGGFSGTKDQLMQPLGLAPDEEDDLVAFLTALTGSPVGAELACDPSPRIAGGVPHRFAACDGGALIDDPDGGPR